MAVRSFARHAGVPGSMRGRRPTLALGTGSTQPPRSFSG